MIDHTERRLALDEAGKGVPLLLLHAFPLSRRMWQTQLAGLAGSCRLLAPDLPGFGRSRSTAPAPGAGDAICRMEEMAAAAVGLLDSLEVAAAVVCGLSMGGYVALALYEGFRERVLGLVLADTRAGADGEDARRRRLESARSLESLGEPALAALADSLMPRLLAPGTLAARPELVAWLRQEIAAASPQGVAAAQRGMAERPDRSDLLARIAVPTLIVGGEEDAFAPPAEAAALRDGIPGALLATIAGAGHLSNLEQADAFNGALRDFVSGFAPPRA